MHLHPDWRAILRPAWSIRLILLAGLLNGLEVLMQVRLGIGTPTITLGVLAAEVTAAAFVARIAAQRDTPDA
jgi:hypothetical protein